MNGKMNFLKKLKDFFVSPAGVAVMFIIAAALILSGGIGGTRAALSVYSEQYNSQLQLSDIGISLLENNEPVGQRDYVPYSAHYEWTEGGSHVLCNELIAPDGSVDAKLQPGRKYKEELSVQNSGNIDEYVRVIVWKYWVDVDENGVVKGKRTDLDPDWIDLHFLTDNSGWIHAAEDTTGDTELSKECTVLYYTNILPVGGTTPLFADTVMINDEIAKKVTETTTKDGNVTKIAVTYDYNGVQFMIEAEADAVQTHNAKDAIKSAWGKDVTFSGDVITSVR